MKRTMNKGAFLLLMLFLSMSAMGQKTDKKVKTFTVERTIQASAQKVWAVVGEDFGAIANSHPKIVSSTYNQGHITGGEDVTRTCNFNKKGTKYLQEKQVSFDPENNGDLIGAPKGKAVGKLTNQKSMNPGFENKELIEEFWKITENLFGKLSALSYKE